MFKILKIVFKIAAGLLILLLAYLMLVSHFDIPQSVEHQEIKALEEPSYIGQIYSIRDYGKIKKDGFNTLVITPPHPIIRNKPREIPFIFSITAYLVKKAHLSGLSVCLAPKITFKEEDRKLFSDRVFQDDLIEISRKWAEFSEKYNVEYYIPVKNPDDMFSRQQTENWYMQVIPDVRERYKGKVGAYFKNNISLEPTRSSISFFSASMSDMQEKNNIFVKIPDIRGYDFIVITVIPPKEVRNIKLFSSDLSRIISGLKRASIRNGLGKVVISGLNVPVFPTKWFGVDYGPVVTRKQQSELVRSNLETVLSNSCDFILIGWRTPAIGIKGTQTEQAVKKVLIGEKQ